MWPQIWRWRERRGRRRWFDNAVHAGIACAGQGDAGHRLDRDRAGRGRAAARRRGGRRSRDEGRAAGIGTVIGPSTLAQVWRASGTTVMRPGFDGLAHVVQETLTRDPQRGQLLVVRDERGVLVEVLWCDGEFASWSSTWIGATSCGRTPTANRRRSQQRNSAICQKV